MNDAERLQHIGELKECLAELLSYMDPPMISDCLARSRAEELRRAADSLDREDRCKRRARELIAKRVT